MSEDGEADATHLVTDEVQLLIAKQEPEHLQFHPFLSRKRDLSEIPHLLNREAGRDELCWWEDDEKGEESVREDRKGVRAQFLHLRGSGGNLQF